jgi:non-heme chloroperoxidase
MSFLTTEDGTRIFYKDMGDSRATTIVLSHGWPLSSDAWDGQILTLLEQGFRVIAHDRRGHGRSEDSGGGHDMDRYADDLAELLGELGVRKAVLVGHGAGGGEIARYIGIYGAERVASVVLVGAVPPVLVSTDQWPRGQELCVFEAMRMGVMENRSRFYRALALPFFGMNREGAGIDEGLQLSFWQQAMAGSIVAHHAGIRAFAEVDFTDDLKAIGVPTLVIHGDDDQIVPIDHAGALSAWIVPQGELRVYEGAPHGLITTHRERLNADLIAFARR